MIEQKADAVGDRRDMAARSSTTFLYLVGRRDPSARQNYSISITTFQP